MRRIYINEKYCIGCRLCEIHCQVKHSKSKKIIKAFKEEKKDMISRVLVEEIGFNSFAIQCRHCIDAPCIEACISGAMTKNNKTETVICDEDKCVGCWSCIMVCPYGVIKKSKPIDKNNTSNVNNADKTINSQNSPKKIASKCDLCPDEDIPVCVKNCPNEALVIKED